MGSDVIWHRSVRTRFTQITGKEKQHFCIDSLLRCAEDRVFEMTTQNRCQQILMVGPGLFGFFIVRLCLQETTGHKLTPSQARYLGENTVSQRL